MMTFTGDRFTKLPGQPGSLASVDSRWRTLGIATVSDALDRLGIVGQALGIRPLTPSVNAVGRAFTVRFVPSNAGDGSVGEFIDDVSPGSIVVLDNGGRCDVTVWGELLTRVARARQLVGTVINGACRDIRLISELGYPVFARANTMRTGKDRVKAVVSNEPVSLGQASVVAGDLVLGDADGVVVVPSARESEVLSAALAIENAEKKIVSLIGNGLQLQEARRVSGYHLLQRPNAEIDTAPEDGKSLADLLEGFSVATIAESTAGACVLPPVIKPLSAVTRIVGRARTVRCAGQSNLWIHRAVYTAEPGDVLVVQTAAEMPAGYWGELLTRAAILRGLSGLIIDGYVRDLDALENLGFPVFARGTCPTGTTKEEGTGGGLDVLLDIDGARVQSGGIVVADRDGIVILPPDQSDAVVIAAGRRTEKEKTLLDGLSAGARLIDLLALSDGN